jgi:hypothetical protein
MEPKIANSPEATGIYKKIFDRGDGCKALINNDVVRKHIQKL